MTKEEIARALEEIATLLELKDENPFKIRAYANAARSIEAWGASFSDLQNEETLEKIPGVGKAIAAKVRELATSGSLKFLEELRAEFPPAILELFTIPGLERRRLRRCTNNCRSTQSQTCRLPASPAGSRNSAGFGETTQAKICKAIENRAKHLGSFQFGAVAAEAEQLRADLAAHPDGLQVSVAGSFRRRREVVRDLDFIVAQCRLECYYEFFLRASTGRKRYCPRSNENECARLRSGIQGDLRVVSNAENPFVINYFTGSKEHNIVMRNRALDRGWTLNEYRLGPAPNAKKRQRKFPR